MRQLKTDLGLRPYRVVSVLLSWSGRKVGVGIPSVVREVERLPTPLVDLSPVRTSNRSAGKVEEGSAYLREVSPRYTEAELQGVLFQGELQPGQEGFLEVRHDSRDGVTERRRFGVEGVPYRAAGKFQWVVKLKRQRPDRKTDGKLDERTEFPERITNPLMAED